MLALYGHPFSSYTWKAQIALYANGTPFTFHTPDGDRPEAAAIVAAASPLGNSRCSSTAMSEFSRQARSFNISPRYIPAARR